MADSLPEVTIGICVWNNESYIAEAIESALSQDYPSIQILVLDDASTDLSPQIIQGYQEKFPETIHCTFSKENHGIGWGRDFLKRTAKSKFFAFLDGDDLYHPQRISTLMKVMLSTGADIVIDAVREIHANGVLADRVIFPAEDYRKDPHFTRIMENMTVLASALMDLESLHDLDFNPELRNAEDWDFWMRCSIAGKHFEFVEEELAYYRRNPVSVTSLRRSIIPWHRQVLQNLPLSLVEETYRSRGYEKQFLAEVKARQCIRRGKYAEALPWCDQAWSQTNDQDRLYLRGVALLYLPEQPAQSHWEQYTSQYPDDPGGWNNLAVAIANESPIDLKRAKECLQRAREQFPAYQDAKRNADQLEGGLQNNELLISETRILSRR